MGPHWDSYIPSCDLVFLLKCIISTQSPNGSGWTLRLQKSHPQSCGRHCGTRRQESPATDNCRAKQSGPRLQPVGRAVSVHPAPPIIWKIVCVRRAEKGLGLCDSTVPSFSDSACYLLTLTLQTTLFTLLLHQRIWGSFASDLSWHLSQALCCKIASYMEICMKKKNPLAKSNT